MRAELQDTVNLDNTLSAAPPLEEPTGLTVLYFRPAGVRPATAWLQLDNDGIIIRRSVQFRRASRVRNGHRVVGFTQPGDDTFAHVTGYRAYQSGASVIGLAPLIHDGKYLDQVREPVTATGGRSFAIVPPNWAQQA
ncbi:hypothetical protein ACWGJ9_09745 [Curtobacterium citreum]